MNMISTTSFELDDGVTEKQNELVKKFAKIWEQKNAKSAKAGGASLMALSLAACGSGSNEAEAPVDLSGAGTTTTHVIQRTETDTTLIWDGQFTDEVQFSGGDLASLFDNNALVADWVAPILTTDTTNAGVVFTGRTTSAADDQIYGDGYAVHGAVIDGGLGNDTLYIDMKSPFAQPLAVVNVENVEIVNVQNIYADDAQEISALEDPDPRYVADSANSEVDLFKVIDMTSLTISEGANAAGSLDVWNVKGGTSLTFEGNFENNVRVDYMDSMASVDMTMSNVSTEALIDVSHNAKTVNLTSTGGGVNDIDGTVFGNANQHLRTLNISGDTELNVGFDSGQAVTFDGDRTATINASSLSADLQIGVAAHTDVNYTGTDRTSGIDSLMVSAADDSGEDRMTLNADFGAGGSGVNTIVYNAQAAGTDYLKAGSTITSDAADGVTLAITGNAAGILNATALANVDAIGHVVFNTDTSLQMTAAQVGAIGIGNFSTYDSVDQDGQLIISNVTSTTDLNLSSMDNGSLVSVRTADASDVTLTATTVLGNLNSGVTRAEIYAESGNSSLTMTADQFLQLDGNGTVVLRGIHNDANTGNNPATNTPYTGNLTITDVAENEVLVLNDVTVSAVGINVGTAGATFTATTAMSITDTGGETVTMNVSGTTDLTNATLTGVDAIVLVGGATLTANAADLAGFDISGQGTINVVGDLTLNTTNNTYDMDEIDLVFSEVAAAGSTSTLTIAGANSLVVQSVSTTANVATLAIDNNLTGAATTFTVTGASPAINLHADTTTFNVLAANDSNTVLGTESDDAATAAVEPSITGSGLTTIAVTGGNATTSVALGAVSGVADTLSISDDTPRTVATSVQLDNIPSTADWTLDRLALTVNEGATIGAGASLNLANNTTIADGSVGLDSLPLSPDSTLVVNSTYTAAEITALLDALESNTATVTVTGMSTAQLQAVAAADNKIAAANGTLSVDNALSDAEITTLTGLADFTAAGNAAYAVITGMTADQLNAVGGTAEWATDGISGTATLTDDVTAGSITNILGDAIRSSTINVDATDMSEGGGSQLAAVATGIGAVDSITNLTLTSASSEAQIETLSTRSSSVTVNAAAMSTAQLTEVADVIEKVGTISNLTLTNAESPALMTTLLSSAAVTAATVNAATMDADDIDAVVANIASVSSVTNYTAVSTHTVAEMTALLGKATAASVTLTGMSSAQTDVVVANAANITNNAANITGETSAAVVIALDAAITSELDATGITKISGSATDLTTVAKTQVGVGDATIDNAVQTVDLAADVDIHVTDAAGETLTSAAINAINDETTGDVTIDNAVTITGTLANLSTELDEDDDQATTTGYEDGEDGVIAATANLTVTDAAATAVNATDLTDLGQTTTGTVTVSNAVAITGTEAEVTAALVTAASKVEAATSTLTITSVATINDETRQQAIEDIDAETSGAIELQLAASATANMSGYAGGSLTITGADGSAEVITVNDSDANSLAGGTGNDTFNITGGSHTITDLGDNDVLTASSGTTVAVTATRDFTATAATSHTSSSVTITLANDIDADLSAATVTSAATDGYTITASGNAAASTIVGSDGVDTITGSAAADTITTGTGADTVILNALTAVDAITGTFGASGDVISIDFSELEGTGDMVYLDDATSLASADVTPVLSTLTGATDLAGITADTTMLIVNNANIANAAALDTALEVGGGAAITTNQAYAVGDTFLAAYDDGAHTYIAKVVVGGDGAANDETFAATELTATNIATLTGITDVTTLVAANFDFIA